MTKSDANEPEGIVEAIKKKRSATRIVEDIKRPESANPIVEDIKKKKATSPVVKAIKEKGEQKRPPYRIKLFPK